MNQEHKRNLQTNPQSDLLQRAGLQLRESAGLLTEAGMIGAANLIDRMAADVLDHARRALWSEALADADHRLNRANAGTPPGATSAREGGAPPAPPSTGIAIYSEAEKKIATACGGKTKTIIAARTSDDGKTYFAKVVVDGSCHDVTGIPGGAEHGAAGIIELAHENRRKKTGGAN